MRTLIAACMIICSGMLFAQTTSGISSDGKDFFIGYVQPEKYNENTNLSIVSSYQAYALISSSVNTNVTVTFFGDDGAALAPNVYHILAKMGVQVPLQVDRMKMDDPGDIPQYRACHISADHPVNVQYFSVGADGGGSYLALATPALGKKYVVASYFDNPPAVGFENPAQGFFLIVAPFPNTSVKITPTVSTKGGHLGTHSIGNTSGKEQSYTINLNRGQCYLVKSGSTDNSIDISGSIVESDRPIAVLGGHENASIGNTSLPIDDRDFMIEQMIPVNFWDTGGYVSIPMQDSKPPDSNYYEVGQNYRVYAYDSTGANVSLDINNFGIRTISASRLADVTPEFFGVQDAVEFHSLDDNKFSVIMYEQRNFSPLGPIPGPSMMTIIPESHWNTKYLWNIPYGYGGKEENESYITVIGQKQDFVVSNSSNGITLAFSGGPSRPIKQVLSSAAEYRSIPNHPDLIGVRMKVTPGNYFAQGPNPFIVYIYSDREYAPVDNDFDGDEWYFSLANPAGALLFAGDSSRLRTQVDSECTDWFVCVHDDRTIDPGILSVTLLNDPQGVDYSVPKVSFNCHLDQVFDYNNSGIVYLDGTNSSVCFKIIIDDPLSVAYAAFLVTDNSGDVMLKELRYSPPVLSTSPASHTLSITGLKLKQDTCFSVVVKNTEDARHKVLSASLANSRNFITTSVIPQPPVDLAKNDSMIISICGSVNDTIPVSATLNIEVDCFSITKELLANGVTGLISADDRNFGAVDTGKSSTMPIEVRNIGKLPFMLNRSALSGSNAFTLIDSSLLPLVLSPGSSHIFRVIYSPRIPGNDTATIVWKTDIESPYTHSIKDRSFLTAQASVMQASVIPSLDKETFNIRPNPAKGNSIIVSFDPQNESSELFIYDVLGREMLHRNISGGSEIEIPIRNFQNGIYYTRLVANGKILMEKFEVMR